MLVQRGPQTDVELQNEQGIAFLRKTAPTPQSARNEAAVLRLFLDEAHRRVRAEGFLKPFALIVDADANGRDGLAEVLRAFGVRVLAVASGNDGLKLAGELTPDLILLGDRLPDLSAADLCAHLRASSLTAPIPIVIVTASPEAILEGDNSGPDVVLGKPCAFETILATSRLLLRNVVPLSEAAGAQVR